VIGGFYIGKHYCTSTIALYFTCIGNEKENFAVFNLVDFCNSQYCQKKFYTKFSSYTVVSYAYNNVIIDKFVCNNIICQKLNIAYRYRNLNVLYNYTTLESDSNEVMKPFKINVLHSDVVNTC